MQQTVIRAEGRSPAAAWPSQRLIEAAIVLTLTVVALWLRIHHLGKQPLWNDEGFTWWAVEHSWGDLWTLVARTDTHPQLYHSLLKVWTGMFGRSEAGLRSLSVAFAALTMPPLFLLGRMIGGERDGVWTGTAAGLLFALSPLHLHYAHEARPYAALTFAATVALTGAVWLILHPEAARRPLLGGDGTTATAEPSARPAWAALSLGTAFALWLHNLAPFFAATLAAALLFWLARDLRWDGRVFLNLVLAGGAAVVLWLPQVYWLVVQTADVASSGDTWYLPFPTWDTFVKIVSSLFGVGYRIGLARFLIGLALAAAGLVAIVWRRGLSLAVLVGLGMVLPIALSLGVSWVFKSVFLERTLVWASIPFYLALAGLLLLLPWRASRVPVMALAGYLAWQGAQTFDRKYKNEPWDRVVQTIAAGQQPGDIVLVMPAYTLPMVEFYERKLASPLPIQPVPLFAAPFAPDEVIPGAAPSPSQTNVLTPPEFAVLQRRLATSNNVWLVYRRTADMDRSDDQLVEYLRSTRPQLRAELLHGQILWLYRFGPLKPDQPGGAQP